MPTTDHRLGFSPKAPLLVPLRPSAGVLVPLAGIALFGAFIELPPGVEVCELFGDSHPAIAKAAETRNIAAAVFVKRVIVHLNVMGRSVPAALNMTD